MLTIRRALVVVKDSELQRTSGDASVARLIDGGDAAVARFRSADASHRATIDAVVAALRARKVAHRVIRRRRGSIAPASAAGVDVIVTVGGDGTLLATSHWAGATPLLAVNSAPADSVGFFCGATSASIGTVLDAIQSGALGPRRLSRIGVELNGARLASDALNDVLVAHASPAATTRYLLTLGGRTEEQRSSGIWISTAVGSTAAIRSAGGEKMPLGSERLQFLVREPYLAHGRAYDLARGYVDPGDRLEIASKVPRGRLFVDGSSDVHAITLGDRIALFASETPLTIFGVDEAKREHL